MLQVNSYKDRRGRIIDTVQFFPHDVSLTISTPVDRVIEAVTELTESITKCKHASPLKGVPVNN